MERSVVNEKPLQLQAGESEGGEMGKSMAAPGFSLEASPIQRQEAPDDPLKVDRGQVTFDAEGNDRDGSIYFSRVIHYPGGNSGVTIGRGFDVGQRGKKANISYMQSAGLSSSQVSLLASASGIKGSAAGDWVKKNKQKVGTITHDQQKKLFEFVYQDHKKDVVRISEKESVVAKYGATDFENQHPAITDILVDLRYRGDYHPRSRTYIQKAAVDNDLKTFASLMSNSKWLTDFGVPKGRFNARKKFINDALAGKNPVLDVPKTPVVDEAKGGEETADPIGTGVITAGALNVRSGPGNTNPVAGKPLTKNTSVKIYEQENGWYRVGVGQWASGKFIDMSEEAKAAVKPTGTVTAAALNVRSGPDASFRKAGEPLRQGEEITVEEEKNGWIRIGKNRWVSGKFVDIGGGAKAPAKPTGTVTASALNVRSGPGGSFRKVGEPLQKGAKITVEEEKNGWLMIGGNRWVSGKFVEVAGGNDGGSAPSSSGKEDDGGGKTDSPANEGKSDAGNNNAPAADQNEKGMVTASTLNVRSGPGADNAKVGKPLTRGDKVNVLKEENGWFMIGEGRWVSAKYVRTGSLIPQNAGGKPNWLSIAEGELGVTEIKGAKHNKRVLEYHQTTGKFGTDEVPWCASFVNWVHKQSGMSGTGSALAMSYKNWGKKVDRPAYGAVAVFSHGGGKGHVGFVVGKQGKNILVLGGNQSNQVKVSSYSTGKIVGYYFPESYDVPESAYSLLGMDEKLETEGYSQTR